MNANLEHIADDVAAADFKIVCPRCDHKFGLNLDCVKFSSCESDPLYAVDVTCPSCAYKKDLYP